ncbi:hypothetical protein BT69DRAFT_1291924 [Atractiella rhizophila]|nr:hypothetical protein BT69DRAFT_1291924 [Atractiella rhizophila]
METVQTGEMYKGKAAISENVSKAAMGRRVVLWHGASLTLALQLDAAQEKLNDVQDEHKRAIDELDELRIEIENAKKKRRTGSITSTIADAADHVAKRAGKAVIFRYSVWPSKQAPEFQPRTMSRPQSGLDDVGGKASSADQSLSESEREMAEEMSREERKKQLVKKLARPYKHKMGEYAREIEKPTIRKNVLKGMREGRSDAMKKIRENLTEIYDIDNPDKLNLKNHHVRKEIPQLQALLKDDSFLFNPKLYDPNDKKQKVKAYLMHPGLFRAARVVFHGPNVIYDAKSKYKSNTVGPLTSTHEGSTQIIAFIAVVCCSALGPDPEFERVGKVPDPYGKTEQSRKKGFNYRGFYLRTVCNLRAMQEKHGERFKRLLGDWNKEVFPSEKEVREEDEEYQDDFLEEGLDAISQEDDRGYGEV